MVNLIISICLILLASCTKPQVADRSPAVLPNYSNQNILKVMVIDTGIDCQNKELTKYTDMTKYCQKQWFNYVGHKLELLPKEQDQNGHGSHVTGLIIEHACKGVEIIPCKYYEVDGSSFNNLANTVVCIQSAIENKVNIINYSSDGLASSKEEKEAIGRFVNMGGTFVSSAGNNGQNLDIVPRYPVSYRLSNMIGVGSLSTDGNKMSSSNFANWLVWELGMSVESWLLDNHRGYMSGTSQACAIHTSKLVANWCASKKKKK